MKHTKIDQEWGWKSLRARLACHSRGYRLSFRSNLSPAVRPVGRRGGLGAACGRAIALMVTLAITAGVAAAQTAVGTPAKWANGLPPDDDYFPIAVWLQAPHNAKKYQQLGFNLYVGLWQGPTAGQLAELKAAGMSVICEQNRVGLGDKNRDVIVGWMHGDEPDNAQELERGKGYGPPIEPKRIVAGYRKLVAADPSRPVLLNLGQGVAWDGWHGRGVRTSHPEDYPAYLKGCDIASFDIYPVTHESPAVTGKLEFVARGVDRLREWGGGRGVWNCIECTRISNVNVKPTPAQVRSEVWMSLIHGSQGLIYFVHQFKPNFVEAGLLADAEMAKAVGDINRQIHELARVLKRPTLSDAVRVTSSDPGVPIDSLVKQDGGDTYVFAVGMRNRTAQATFRCRETTAAKAEVIGEDRTIKVTGGVFTDEFAPYAVHLYRVTKTGGN